MNEFVRCALTGPGEFAPQLPHHYFHAVGATDRVIATVLPYLTKDCLLGQDDSDVVEEEPEQTIFRWGERDLSLVQVHAMARVIHPQCITSELLARGRTARASKDSFDPEYEFLKAERFGEVVVPGGEAHSKIGSSIPSGQKDDRHVVAVATQPLAQLKPIDIGKIDVEHHEIGNAGAC